MNSGKLRVLNGALLNTMADFSNTGTLTIGAASVFTVNGSYSQDPSATLEIQLGGTAATGQFGQLLVTGTAALGGTLTVTSVNNYVPQSADSFTILTFAARAKTDFANAPAGFSLTYDDGMGTLTLTAQ